MHLQIECQRKWNKKLEVILVIIGANGVFDRNNNNNNNNLFYSNTINNQWRNRHKYTDINVSTESNLS